MQVSRAIVGAGISRATFNNWKVKGKQEDSGIFADFLEDIKKAEVKFEESNLNILRAAARSKKAHPNWTAAAWLLERVHFERYGRKNQIVKPAEEKKKPNVKSVLDAVERVSKRMAEREKPSGSD